ncbi:MAG: aspartate--tRNA ligase [Oscillospiraceae bacterium]|jgi:aspartyl-tRNA synthetase|nr:aspartate--tRNA ligase [Oscillospiraceae bacterium]
MNSYARTDWCGAPRISDAGRETTVCGWVGRRRDLGRLIFIDLRDRSGVLQLAFDDSTAEDVFAAASAARAEYVLAARGVLRERSAKNPELPTGDVELEVRELRILAVSETPPFEIADGADVNDALRLKYRYLDLRRPSMQRAVELRHRVTKLARDYFDEQGFLEIETPMLTKSTPEGARDYLVPSRAHPGRFYALPQSPQQYKQLLMVAGFDRYFQITRCFRDEDLRADRQPEFTQIDIEMSFAGVDDVIAVNEGFLKRVFAETLGVEIELPIMRLKYREAMERFGSDKPDTRFGLELVDIGDIARGCGFKVFSEAMAAGGGVRLINVPGGASAIPRKQIDALTDFVKAYGAKGLAWTRLTPDGASSSYSKFLTDDENAAVSARAGARTGDLTLIVADASESVVFAALGALRRECAGRLGLIKAGEYKLLWVTEFPMFEYSEDEGRYVAVHHPFTAPLDGDEDKLLGDKGGCRAKAYDIILNGTELGGGSIRISTPQMQERMFKALGFTEEDARERFGHLITAFRYGAPPHGGLAYGLDRLVMLLCGADSIRDVIAFPKVQNASELMTGAPGEVAREQLDELAIKTVAPA